MGMDVFVLFGVLLLLFVVAVFWFGSKDHKSGHSKPKQKGASQKDSYRRQVFRPGSKDYKQWYSEPNQKGVFWENSHKGHVYWRWGEVDKEGKGIAGERAVAEILSRLPYEYRVFNNVLLNNPFGGTAQIDHIVVSPSGVFVIETKNFSGKVYGSVKAKYWKEYIRGEEYPFINPVRQNKMHIAVLAKNLASFDVPFFSVVAFSPEADLRVFRHNGTDVLYWNDLLDMFRYYEHERMSQSKADAFGFELDKVRIKGMEGYQRHVEETQAYVQRKKKDIQDGICPYCGGKLVRRNGPFGEFFGCSTYPDCTFMEKIEN